MRGLLGIACLGEYCLGVACLGVMIVKLYSTQISDLGMACLGMACLDVVCHDSKIDPIHISGSNFEATVDVDMLGPNGYLSIVDWPLLPFYGLMCGLYVAMGLGWLVVCSMHWRDLLRIQFWIGAVIFLGKNL